MGEPTERDREYFSCKCGIKQTFAPKNVSGGITEKEAHILGWRKIDNKWQCPKCCGNLEALKKVFGFGKEIEEP